MPSVSELAPASKSEEDHIVYSPFHPVITPEAANSEISPSTNHCESPALKPSVPQKSESSKWSRKFDFILAVMGANIGLSNMLRFPYICMKNGGGTFLVPYFIFLFIFGIPLFMLELSMGQYSGLSPIIFWESVCPLLKGIGWCYITYSGLFNVYYNVQMSWALNYLVYSFKSPLPWSTCNNSWNTQRCYDFTNASNVFDILTDNCPMNNTRISSTEEFWENQVLDISSGIHETGYLLWSLLLGLIITWILVFLCLFKGIHTLGKVVYFTVLGPYILLLILLVRGLLLPGGKEGVQYYMRVDWARLGEPNVWLQAALQIFFSLAPCWGITIAMASHNAFFNNIYQDAIILPLMSGFTSFFAGFVTFTFVGTIAYQMETSIDCVMKTGPGLAFIVYPEALTTLSLPQLWSVLFFFLLVLLGLDSSFTTFEVVHHGLVEYYPNTLKKHELLTKAALSLLFCLLAVPMTTSGGHYIYQLIDWYQSTLFMILALMEVLGFAFCYGANRVRKNIEQMTQIKLTPCWTILWMVVIPLILVWLQIMIFLTYSPVTYGTYNYPTAAIACGWLIAVLSIAPLPIMAAHEVTRAICENRKSSPDRRRTVIQVLRSTIKNKELWEANALAMTLEPVNGQEKSFEDECLI